MLLLRSRRKITLLFMITVFSGAFLTACSNLNETKSEVSATGAPTEGLISSEQPAEEQPSYETTRKTPIAGEFPMIKMEQYDSEVNKDAISGKIKEEIPEYTSQIYYYNDNDFEVIIYAEDSNENNAVVWIQGKKYPFSFGETYYLRNGENPEICFFDVNQDGALDIMIRSEAYRTLIRQDVYLSDGAEGYKELGDITWSYENSYSKFPFQAFLADDFKAHVSLSEYEIDKIINIGTTFRQDAKTLGLFDDNGKVTDEGKQWVVKDLQSQAVRYILQGDETVKLRYEAQIWAGYSEDCLGCCFVFEYEITNEGYHLLSVTLEEFDY